MAAGNGVLEGDAQVLQQLNAVLINFDPGFEIMPGTR